MDCRPGTSYFRESVLRVNARRSHGAWDWAADGAGGCLRCSSSPAPPSGCFRHDSSNTSSCRCSQSSARCEAMTIPLIRLLQIAGVLHLGLMAAGLMMPGVVNMRAHLAGLPAFVRQLFWVYYSFIALCLVSFSAIT